MTFFYRKYDIIYLKNHSFNYENNLKDDKYLMRDNI